MKHGEKNPAGIALLGLLLLLVPVLLSPAPACAQRDYQYIDISNPFLRKIPMAVPAFAVATESPDELQSAEKAARILSESLEFTSYFKIIDPLAYLEEPRKIGVTADHLHFRNWTVIGAEMLITGQVAHVDGLLQIDLRLFDPFKEELLVGKRYRGAPEDYRRMVRRFCSEVIHLLTGDWGIFESKIAFVSTGTGSKEIYLCDFDGYDPKQWTHLNSITLSPAWSSDGKWIAYTAYAKGKPDLYIRHLEDKRGVVVDREGINISPAWVPGQFALAATLSFSGDPEIYLLTGSGKIIKRITKKWGIDESPSWSPDGKKMAFVSNRSGTPQIFIHDMETERTERLTYSGQYNTQPAWSPKGDKIAYTAMEDGEINIHVIGTDGSAPLSLTRASGDNESPTWSPDGSLIAFKATREGSSRIYVMTAFGTDQRRLLTLPGEQSSPAWSPGGGEN
ncbi:MAG: Tol-Pal system beta propeller repeat protein TolB [Desulfobacterales bacterium]|jgi:TolB protein